MTNFEKIEAEEAKQKRIIENNYCCEVCKKRFGASQLQLAHKISASKPNIKKFGRDVMYHHDMMVLTCEKHNSDVLINYSSNPIEASELIIDILSKIILDDPVVFKYSLLMKAFDNIDKTKVVNVVSVGQYELLENFFEHYRNM